MTLCIKLNNFTIYTSHIVCEDCLSANHSLHPWRWAKRHVSTFSLISTTPATAAYHLNGEWETLKGTHTTKGPKKEFGQHIARVWGWEEWLKASVVSRGCNKNLPPSKPLQSIGHYHSLHLPKHFMFRWLMTHAMSCCFFLSEKDWSAESCITVHQRWSGNTWWIFTTVFIKDRPHHSWSWFRWYHTCFGSINNFACQSINQSINQLIYQSTSWLSRNVTDVTIDKLASSNILVKFPVKYFHETIHFQFTPFMYLLLIRGSYITILCVETVFAHTQ